ncbi:MULTISPECIES: hypothetical protein [Bradyrhizobium]|uniref:hypothetical protein n=1 Tax=Bradyrhizobium TaxID=374 RepID=UPI00155E870A|nr:MULTISPECIES: hypothetical protein [Bradyrhizobium]MDD1520743.1 hypothetical protein [Bradyrhizobium sp. WBAH30]MDD1545794.1 hypothetical protein [Bradyrhizobium sp. WBAH41]MDD1558945.1 hypothetical protein [Bradyrhizobium sp. WBAH23]MDD1566405.1 hypothetical protein [Bradyrhizobium sp. WBAH33]MDD1591998.1 hypothetical protein [Bradyrhizobium sp. WBAH42]
MRTAGRYAWIAISISLVLSSGAHALFETRDAKLKDVKTIGIVSAIGDQFTYAKTGLTGINNSPRNVPIASWGLDDLIAQEMAKALSNRFQVQPVTYPRATFATTQESAIGPVNLVRGDPFKKLVQTEVSPQGLDAYIIITKAKASFGGGSRKVEGVGLITYSTVLESFDLLHALYEVRVIDGKTFDVIEKLAAGPQDGTSSVRLPGPSLMVDAGFDTRDENLRRTIVDLIVRSLPNTLSDLHLINRQP